MDKFDISNIKSITALSDSNFYQKIIKKYQRSKSNPFIFTIMIFYKNKEHIFSQKINMSILLQLHLYNQNIVPPFIEKSIPATKGIFSWLNTEKITLPSIVKRKIAQSLNEITNFFRAENMTTESNKILKQLFLDLNTAFYQQVNHTVSSVSAIVNTQFLNYGNYMVNYGDFIRKYWATTFNNSGKYMLIHYMQIIYPQILRARINYKSVNTAGYSTFIEKENAHEYQFMSEHKSSAILSQDNLLFNRTSTLLSISTPFFNNTNWTTINKPLIKNNYHNFGPGAASFARRYAYKTGDEKGSGNLRFNNRKHIEQEIEQIKKIVVETKESVLEKTTPALGEADIKRYLDINRISDQVYQNIERTIRMERERRGM